MPGGSGIVVVRYPIGVGYAGTGGAIVDSGGFRYHRFTSSGTFTLTAQPAPPNVTVPNVVGQTEAAARSAITAAQLAVGTVSRAAHGTIPAGITISQNPAAGASVPQSSAVSFVVSTGVQLVVVPNVVGSTETTARNSFAAAGLVTGTVTYVSSLTVAAAIVMSQSPAAGASVVVGSAVTLTVSGGTTAGAMFLAVP
jgi:serine/threonine-protein kinase